MSDLVPPAVHNWMKYGPNPTRQTQSMNPCLVGVEGLRGDDGGAVLGGRGLLPLDDAVVVLLLQLPDALELGVANVHAAVDDLLPRVGQLLGWRRRAGLGRRLF